MVWIGLGHLSNQLEADESSYLSGISPMLAGYFRQTGRSQTSWNLFAATATRKGSLTSG